MDFAIISFVLCLFLVIVGCIGSYVTQKTKCRFCAEVIDKQAVKCPKCKEHLR